MCLPAALLVWYSQSLYDVTLKAFRVNLPAASTVQHLVVCALLVVGYLRFVGKQLLLEVDAQLLSNVLQLLQVGLVLRVVLNLVLQGLESSDSGGVVVDTSARLQRLLNDDGRGDQVVGEAVVQDSLHLKEVVGAFELLLVSAWC